MVVSRESVVLVHSPPLDWLADYLQRFYGVRTQVLSPLDIDTFELPTRMRGPHRQYDARALVDVLSPLLPSDAYAMIVVVNRDLFIYEAQQYAFGYGLHRERLAVMTFGRLDPIFDGLPRPVTWQADTARRSLTVIAHEVGHTFGMRHCSYYACALNGMSHLKEVDATPPHLCPVCLRKLVSLGGVDPVRRYEDLARFYAAAQMHRPAAWVESRLSRLRGPMATRG